MSHAIRLLLAAALAAAAGSAWSDSAWADGDAARGEKKFEECQACHSLDRNAESVGPSLYGVFERKAGSGTDFRYSPAMKRSGLTWDEASLRAYITDPQGQVKGNRMPFAGIKQPSDADDVVAYLKTLN